MWFIWKWLPPQLKNTLNDVVMSNFLVAGATISKIQVHTIYSA
jgi:hypothetical protein